MNNTVHNLLDDLMDEVKQSLVDQQIAKFKKEILDMVAKQQEEFLQDTVQICDGIYREMLHAAGQMIKNEKQELLISKQELLEKIHAMVEKEVRTQLKSMKEEKDQVVGEDTQGPRIFFRTGLLKPEVYQHMQRQKQEQEQESQSLLADNDDLMQ